MKDVLTVAIERQRELRNEVTELDNFIQLAESLLRNATTRADERSRPDADPRRDLPEPVEAADADAESAQDDTDEEQDTVDSEEAGSATDAGVRKFPWTGMQPAVRRSGNDDGTSPARRNVFRRDMSAAG